MTKEQAEKIEKAICDIAVLGGVSAIVSYRSHSWWSFFDVVDESKFEKISEERSQALIQALMDVESKP